MDITLHDDAEARGAARRGPGVARRRAPAASTRASSGTSRKTPIAGRSTASSGRSRARSAGSSPRGRVSTAAPRCRRGKRASSRRSSIAGARAASPVSACRSGPTILRLGTDEQKAAFLPGMAAGEIMWAEGYTEPNSGSDLASLRTRAVLDGDEWVIDGQKTFCTAGHHCNWIIIAARTDPDYVEAPQGHQLLPRADGHRRASSSGRSTNLADGRQNLVFLDDVRVPAEPHARRPQPGLAAGVVRPRRQPDPDLRRRRSRSGGGVRARTRPATRGCSTSSCSTAGRRRADGTPLADDPVVRMQLADLAIGVEVEKLLAVRGQCAYGTHLHQAITKEFQPEFAQTCMEILGPLGQIQTGEWAPLAGEIDRIYRRSFGNHAGGTSQVKRMVVATRGARPAAVGRAPWPSISRSTTTSSLVQRSANEFFQRRYPSEVVRAIEDGDVGYSPELWREMAGARLVGHHHPRGVRRCAAAASSTSIRSTRRWVASWCRARISTRSRSRARRSSRPAPTRSASAASRRSPTATASSASRSSRATARSGPAPSRARRNGSGGDFVVSGTKLLVPFARVSRPASSCAVRTSGDAGRRHLAVARRRATPTASRATPIPNIAGQRAVRGALRRRVDAGREPRRAGGLRLGAAVGRDREGARCSQTATIVGAAHAVLDMTNQYAKDREQFGGPIGRYQAVQYLVHRHPHRPAPRRPPREAGGVPHRRRQAVRARGRDRGRVRQAGRRAPPPAGARGARRCCVHRRARPHALLAPRRSSGRTTSATPATTRSVSPTR